MPAMRRISLVQLEELILWMESHPLLAKSSYPSSLNRRHQIAKMYEELASRLNAVGEGVTKTPKEWREYWSDLKYKVKKKGSQLGLGTDGGPTADILNPIEERICTLIGAPIPPRTLTPSMSPARPKRKHSIKTRRESLPPIDTPPPPEEMSILVDPPRWALDLEERRVEEEEARRHLEERRLALEEARLEEERAFREEGRAFRSQLLAVLNRMADSMTAFPSAPEYDGHAK